MEDSIKFTPVPPYGDHMKILEFFECVQGGGFIDYDGIGYWATLTQISNISIRPSVITHDHVEFYQPSWATHVVWFNR